jgi:glutaminyl-tRNA synthetase
MSNKERESLNFLEEIVTEDIKNGKHGGTVLTRFPPEPNGYLHIGHIKAICINFKIAEKFNGETNLRFDDTNPTNEDTEYVDAIKEDIAWLGFQWKEELYASDYFGKLYEFAHKLIDDRLAYVDESTPKQIAEMKGTTTQTGVKSPYRNRPVEENKDLFSRMKNGEFEDGAMVLRAKIDMASTNMLMRDPIIYRIKHEHHHRTGNDWCIYPMYDFAHGQSDSIEHITHSLCSLEFIHHRPLYDWFIEKLDIFPSRQIEFSRMNVEYMITSKRKLKKLVEDKYVDGCDDPRMSTISGMRRRGYPAKAFHTFYDKVGTTKRDNLIEFELLESCVRDELNAIATRVMVITDPIKLTITDYPEGQVEWLETINNPEDESSGSRSIPFSKHLLIERSDFMSDAPKKYYRLSEGRDVRLKSAYIIHCEKAIRNESGEVVEVLCTYYDNSKSGEDVSGIRSKGTLHWVSEAHGLPCEIRNYDKLYTDPTPGEYEGKDVFDFINPDSLIINDKAIMEPSLKEAAVGDYFQFMRLGYYTKDKDSTEDKTIFNLTVSLKGGYKPNK